MKTPPHQVSIYERLGLAPEANPRYPNRMATRTRRRALMNAAKLSAPQLEEWEEALQGLFLHSTGLVANCLKTAAAMRLTASRAKAYSEAGYNLIYRLKEVTTLHQAGVSPGYLELEENPAVAWHIPSIISLHAAGVPREDITGHALSADDILGLRDKGVPTAYAGQLARAGMLPEAIIESWEHGLSAEYAAAVGGQS